MFESMQISVVGRENEDNKSEEPDDDQSSSGSEDLDEDEYFKEDHNKISQKHQKHTDLEERAREDMDFPDEVDTPFKDARQRFEKYRGIKSLKNCNWDPYENLPPEYSKIWRFENFQAEVKKQKDLVEAEGLPINGTYITLVLEVENMHVFSEI
jgi:pre-rRNA-processing protein TSR1